MQSKVCVGFFFFMIRCYFHYFPLFLPISQSIRQPVFLVDASLIKYAVIRFRGQGAKVRRLPNSLKSFGGLRNLL